MVDPAHHPCRDPRHPLQHAVPFTLVGAVGPPDGLLRVQCGLGLAVPLPVLHSAGTDPRLAGEAGGETSAPAAPHAAPTPAQRRYGRGQQTGQKQGSGRTRISLATTAGDPCAGAETAIAPKCTGVEVR